MTPDDLDPLAQEELARLTARHVLGHPAALVTAPADRPLVPKLDLGRFHRHAIALAMIVVAGLGAYVMLRTYAGAYVTFLESWAPLTRAYHAVFPVAWWRHLVVRDGYEKVYAGATLQVVVYYFATKGWPRKEPNRWDRIERRLGVANHRIDKQGVWALLLSIFVWLPVYALPGMALVAAAEWFTGQDTLHPAPWQITVTGLAGSFVFGRRIAKGVAYHLQRIIDRERLEGGHTRPAWWMLWPMRWRFDWDAAHWQGSALTWKHLGLQRAVHRAVIVAALLVALWLTYVGWYVLKYQGFSYAHPFAALGFRWGDLWQRVLW